LGRYLDIAKGIPRTEPEPPIPSAYPKDPTKPDTENARRLLEAGWKPKVSFGGKVIWERPDTGFWVSEQMALHLLENKGTKGDQKA
jgi:hypothetical protein